MLVEREILSRSVQSLLMAASEIRNVLEHPRGAAYDLDRPTAEAALAAAGTAITFIASRLPPADTTSSGWPS